MSGSGANREVEMLTEVCVKLGAPEEQARTMAAQLLKRADQLAEERGTGREDELRRLLQLVIAGREGRAEVPNLPVVEE